MSRAQPPPAWQDLANCVGAPQILFFPERPAGNTRGEANSLITRQIAEAKTICAACIVRDECLSYALTFPAFGQYGVWGGMTPRERRRLRRENLTNQRKVSA